MIGLATQSSTRGVRSAAALVRSCKFSVNPVFIVLHQSRQSIRFLQPCAVQPKFTMHQRGSAPVIPVASAAASALDCTSDRVSCSSRALQGGTLSRLRRRRRRGVRAAATMQAGVVASVAVASVPKQHAATAHCSLQRHQPSQPNGYQGLAVLGADLDLDLGPLVGELCRLTCSVQSRARAR